jgi:mRNA interferase MazF
MASRGEIWLAALSPTRGHEQAGTRPVLVLSTDPFNHGPASLVVVTPLTTTDRANPLRVPIDPPNGGVRERSFAMPDMVRSISTDRLVRCWGCVAEATMREVEDRLRILLEL